MDVAESSNSADYVVDADYGCAGVDCDCDAGYAVDRADCVDAVAVVAEYRWAAVPMAMAAAVAASDYKWVNRSAVVDSGWHCSTVY